MAEALDPAIPAAEDDLAKLVLREACERGVMLAAAESCTGGLLSALLTDIPGRSHAFERGLRPDQIVPRAPTGCVASPASAIGASPSRR